MEYNICVLSLSDPALTDDRLTHLLATAPQRTVILLEDVDAAFYTHDDSRQKSIQYQGLNRITFSGLLNALDGVAASEGRLLFMTTNHVDRLDPALIRPGRVDVRHYFGDASIEQIEKMFLSFYPETIGTDHPNQFAKKFKDCSVSMAELQGFLMLFKNAPQQCLEYVEEYASTKKNAKKKNDNE